jgi:hypothetical protein
MTGEVSATLSDGRRKRVARWFQVKSRALPDRPAQKVPFRLDGEDADLPVEAVARSRAMQMAGQIARPQVWRMTAEDVTPEGW